MTPSDPNDAPYSERFRSYLSRDVANQAAKSLSDGVEIEFHVGAEKFTFTRENKTNAVKSGRALDAHIIFELTPGAADELLENPKDDVGETGVQIMRLIVSDDDGKRIHVRLKAGFLTLMRKGYLGVLAAGGKGVTSFLASRGLSGTGGIKKVITKLKG